MMTYRMNCECWKNFIFIPMKTTGTFLNFQLNLKTGDLFRKKELKKYSA